MYNYRMNNVLPKQQVRQHAFAAFKRDRKAEQAFTKEELALFDNEWNWQTIPETEVYED